MRAVLCKCAIDFHFIAELHRGPSPSTSLQTMRRTHFPAPIFYSAVGLLHIDVKPDMRISPFDFCHKTLHRDRLTCVEFSCKRMVRDRRYREQHDTET